jgi:hypothetical protein
VLLFDPTNADDAAYNPPLEVRLGERDVRDVQNINDAHVDPRGALEPRNHSKKTSHSPLHLAGPRRPTVDNEMGVCRSGCSISRNISQFR